MKKPNAEQLWKHLEDDLVPRLHLNVIERAVYSFLIRHSRLEGRRRFCVPMSWLARAFRLNTTTVRLAVRRLAGKRALRIVSRTHSGHLLEVFLPEEVRGGRVDPGAPAPPDLENLDFFSKRELRHAIHRREGGRCFYCLRQLGRHSQCLDHVVPGVSNGSNSYRNLVSCCLNCNVSKSGMPAEDFLRKLYRLRRLSAHELAERLRALAALAAGKLKPVVVGAGLPRPAGTTRKGRPRLNPAA